ncbi:hypothetical protein PSAC2689_40105 [Paraburkholderia sacchari]
MLDSQFAPRFARPVHLMMHRANAGMEARRVPGLVHRSPFHRSCAWPAISKSKPAPVISTPCANAPPNWHPMRR